jgi:hypothetical protein
MFKVLVLQHMNNISDDETEYLIRDRYSFSRFLSLLPEDNIPGAKIIWLFREQLVQHRLFDPLFDQFNRQLDLPLALIFGVCLTDACKCGADINIGKLRRKYQHYCRPDYHQQP